MVITWRKVFIFLFLHSLFNEKLLIRYYMVLFENIKAVALKFVSVMPCFVTFFVCVPFCWIPETALLRNISTTTTTMLHMFSVFTVWMHKPMKINHQWNTKEMDERIVTVKLQKAHKSFIKGVHPTRAVPSLLKPFNRFVWVRDWI